MNKLRVLLAILFGVATISLTSCGWKASEEEKQQLEETRDAALSAEKTLADKKAEKADLEAKVAAKKAELEKVKADKASVEAKAAEAAEADSE